MSDDDRLMKTVLQCLGEVVPNAPVDDLDPARSFRDQVEMDSMDFLNFVSALEQQLGVRIPEEAYPRLSSPRGCVEFLRTMD